MTSLTANRLIQEIGTSLTSEIQVVRTLSDCEYLVAMPHTLADGSPVLLRVDLGNDDLVTATDDAQVANELDIAGLNLTAKGTRASWDALRKTIGFHPNFGTSNWEIAASAEREHVGPLLHALADAAIRADALRLVAPGRRPKTFTDRMAVRLHEAEVALVPRAVVPGSAGHRAVSFSIGVKRPRYLQTVSRAATRDARSQKHDRAVAIFAGSSLPMEQRIGLFEGSLSTWEPKWHLDSLRKHARVVSDLDIAPIIEQVHFEDAAA